MATTSKAEANRGTFRKGRAKTGGRPPGSPNRTTKELKEAILAALEELGGITYLAELGKTNPDLFVSMLCKIIPSEIRQEQSGKLLIEGGLPERDRFIMLPEKYRTREEWIAAYANGEPEAKAITGSPDPIRPVGVR